MKRRYPRFVLQVDRDEYLDRLIANGCRVKAEDILLEIPFINDPFFNVMYTVVDIDKRRGK